ncbi:hypothetical protein CR513_42452, partial [Mucuna pruriens]
MAISNSRQRNMPSMEDRERGESLAYPEAVLLTHPSNQQFKDEVDDKYQYSSENKDNSVHGWITEDNLAPEGFWMITPSNEFRNAGPIKQDLTSHVGPIFVYHNSAPNRAQFRSLWSDAVEQVPIITLKALTTPSPVILLFRAYVMT